MTEPRKCCNNCVFYKPRYRCTNPLNAEDHGDTFRMMTTDGFMVCDRHQRTKENIHHHRVFDAKLGGTAKVVRNRYWQKGDPEWEKSRTVESAAFERAAWNAMAAALSGRPSNEDS